MLLDRCDGPECPRCGCRDATILQEPRRPHAAGAQADEDLPYILPSSMDPAKASAWRSGNWWDAGRARCNHCGTAFSYRDRVACAEERVDCAEERTAPEPRETTCPACGGSRYWVYKTRGDVRYRKCRDCQHRGDGNKSLVR